MSAPPTAAKPLDHVVGLHDDRGDVAVQVFADRHGGAYSLDEQAEEGEAPYPEPASPGHLLIEQKMILKDRRTK